MFPLKEKIILNNSWIQFLKFVSAPVCKTKQNNSQQNCTNQTKNFTKISFTIFESGFLKIFRVNLVRTSPRKTKKIFCDTNLMKNIFKN